MDWKLFIARRIYRSNEGGKEVSKPAVRIAMLGIAIGLAVKAPVGGEGFGEPVPENQAHQNRNQNHQRGNDQFPFMLANHRAPPVHFPRPSGRG